VGERELACPEMRWIGIRSVDLHTASSESIPLTEADQTKAQRMIEGIMSATIRVAQMADCQTELQRMLMLNQKAEIQALDGWGLSSWLECSLSTL
jgi:meiotic recombination protein SPO11